MNLPILNRKNPSLPGDGWHQIEVSGRHPAGPGREQLIDDKARASIIMNFRKQAEAENFAGVLVDLDHLSHRLDNSTEAYAWLHEVEERDGELYGRLEWTDLGTTAVTNKRVKWFSTEYDADDLEEVEPGLVRPLRLSGLALTNRPNNRGGRPISNREEESPDPAGKPATNKTMKTIAEKLGLPAEATEEQILGVIGEMQSELDTLRNKAKDAEAEEILNRHAKRIPEGTRENWKALLLCNREATERTIASMPEIKPSPAPDRIHNRSLAKTPEGGAVEGDDARHREQQAFVAGIRNRDNSTFQRAWETARQEKPELFK